MINHKSSLRSGKDIVLLYCKCEVTDEPKGKKTRNGWKNCRKCGKIVPWEKTRAALAQKWLRESGSAVVREELESRKEEYGKGKAKVVEMPPVDPFQELKDLLGGGDGQES